MSRTRSDTIKQNQQLLDEARKKLSCIPAWKNNNYRCIIHWGSSEPPYPTPLEPCSLCTVNDIEKYLKMQDEEKKCYQCKTNASDENLHYYFQSSTSCPVYEINRILICSESCAKAANLIAANDSHICSNHTHSPF